MQFPEVVSKVVSSSYPMENIINFSDWLLLELNDREWTQADLARKAKIKTATLSRIMTGARNAGKQTAESIATALDYPPEFVFRMAGILPPDREKNPTDEELLHLYNQLDPDEQEEIRKWVRFKVEENKKKK